MPHKSPTVERVTAQLVTRSMHQAIFAHNEKACLRRLQKKGVVTRSNSGFWFLLTTPPTPLKPLKAERLTLIKERALAVTPKEEEIKRSMGALKLQVVELISGGKSATTKQLAAETKEPKRRILNALVALERKGHKIKNIGSKRKGLWTINET